MILDRTFHPDEANQAFTTGRLLDTGEYVYNPQDHHGPTLYYAAAALQKATGHNSTATLDGTLLRCTPIIFSVLALLFGFLAARKLSGRIWHGILFALLLGTSPIFVFFSTDFIQEMLLASFSIMMLWAGMGYLRLGGKLKSGSWALLFGITAGLAFATKETSVLTFAAATIAALPLAILHVREAKARIRDAVLAFAGFALTAMLFYSSFGENWHGIYNAFIAAPFSYLHRAIGSAASQGAAAHIHPWWQYFKWLFDGNIFFFALAFIGIFFGGVSLAAKDVRCSLPLSERRAFAFFATYATVIFALYSAIPYKTPWCSLQMHIPILLCSILGTLISCSAICVVVQRRCRTAPPTGIKILAHMPIVAITLLMTGGGTVQIAKMWQDPDSKKIPYNYASASPQAKELASLVLANMDTLPSSTQTNAQALASFAAIVLPPEDTWPLPFYLRSIKDRVGYWTSFGELEALAGLGQKPNVVIVPAEEGHLVQPIFPHLKNTKRFEMRPHVRVRAFW